jgi:oxygen-dependent protoporphyrinogen oxidase
VAIVGGGISGLSAAYDLQKAGGFQVVLFEESPKVGGKIQTAHERGYLIEQGPDSIFSVKPWATDLMAEIGMETELMEPLSNSFSILTKGKLHNVPRALASLTPAASGALEQAAFLSASSKRRALKEAEIAAGDGGDESISSFFSRRFGSEFSRLIAEPLLAGTHAGDPTKLSMAALYPSYLSMERSHGSISAGAAARTSANVNGRKAGFLALRGGMGEFPQRLAGTLTDVQVMTSTQVSAISAKPSGFKLETSSGTHEAEHLILTVPAYAASYLLADIAPGAAEKLGDIRFVSTAIATLAYRREAFAQEPTGNGFLVPYTDSCPLSGCTWSSNKWAGRAPANILLMRAFMGRDGGLDIEAYSNDQLVALATETLEGLLGPKEAPIFARLDRWTKGLPQYEMGHTQRLASVEEALTGLPISLAGCSYRGNSIPDCVRQGREAAAKLIKSQMLNV